MEKDQKTAKLVKIQSRRIMPQIFTISEMKRNLDLLTRLILP